MPAKKRKKPAARKRAKRPAKKAKKPVRRKPRAKAVALKLRPANDVEPTPAAEPINEDRRSPIWRVIQWMFPF